MPSSCRYANRRYITSLRYSSHHLHSTTSIDSVSQQSNIDCCEHSIHTSIPVLHGQR